MGTIQWTMILMAGILAGAGLGFWLGRMGRRGDVERIAEAETELKAYRDRVTEHFGQSAAHFQAIGQQYRELYEHMAAGSESLCEISESDERLRFPRPNELVIDSSAAAEEGAGSESAPVLAEDAAEEEAASTPTAEEAASEQDVESPGADPQLVKGDEATVAETEVEAAEPATADPDSDPSNRIYH